jgi:hypothetical protein
MWDVYVTFAFLKLYLEMMRRNPLVLVFFQARVIIVEWVVVSVK